MMKITKSHVMGGLVGLAILLVLAQTDFIDYFNGKEKLIN